MNSKQQSTWSARAVRLVLATAIMGAFAVSVPTAAHAENLIQRPGAHNRYKFELEPHLSLYWQNHWYANNYRTEVGPGIRASIPFMHNGPIDTINNNIAISFGADTYFPYGDFWLHVPVAFQWNFYFTDIISVLGEVGLATNFWDGGGGLNVDFDPVFHGGGRFQFGKVGILVRMGYPDVTVGANIQF